MLARINPAVGVVETVDEHNSILVTGADSLATVAAYVGMLELDFRVAEPPELVDHVRRVGERYLRAAPARRGPRPAADLTSRPQRGG